MDFIELLAECQGYDTQEEFATKLGITQAAVSRILNRKRRAGVSVLQGLIAAYPHKRDEAVRLFLLQNNTDCHDNMTESMKATA